MIRWRMVLAAPGLAIALASCAVPGKSVTPPANPAALSDKEKPAQKPKAGAVTSITFEDFFARHQAGKVLVYDARSAFFYGLGHIPGAINLPHTASEDRIQKIESKIESALAKGDVIVTYCTGTNCPDAGILANRLAELGHPVSVFSGGWHAWNEADLPIE